MEYMPSMHVDEHLSLRWALVGLSVGRNLFRHKNRAVVSLMKGLSVFATVDGGPVTGTPVNRRVVESESYTVLLRPNPTRNLTCYTLEGDWNPGFYAKKTPIRSLWSRPPSAVSGLAELVRYSPMDSWVKDNCMSKKTMTDGSTWSSTFVYVLWLIWKACNGFIFNGKSETPNQVVKLDVGWLLRRGTLLLDMEELPMDLINGLASSLFNRDG
nr:uncharacterized protein LOC109176414 [Ipomoea trifida]